MSREEAEPLSDLRRAAKTPDESGQKNTAGEGGGQADKPLHASKMKMAANRGEIVRNEGLNHQGTDNYESFSHGTIDVRAGNPDYRVDIVKMIPTK